MSLATARETIVRKFTNYRNKHKDEDEGSARHQETMEKMEASAAVLVDFRSYSKGKRLFRKRMYDDIVAKRELLQEQDPSLCQIAAFQKALKSMWDNADQDYWETQAAGDPDDIYE